MSKKQLPHDANFKHPDMETALYSTDIPNIYFNQFMVAVSDNDVVIVLQRNMKKEAEAVLNLSYPVAKALSRSINDAIGDFELKTRQKTADSEHSEE